MDAQPDSAAPCRQHPLTQRRARPRQPWLAGAAQVAVVAALLIGCAPHRTAGSPAGAPTGAAATWPLYRDPARLFTVRVPSGWTANTNTSTATVGDRTGSGQETIEETALRDPAGSTITVYISAYAYDSPFLHGFACRERGPAGSLSATVAGLPAVYSPRTGWTFDSNTAHYQVGYLFPGDTGSTLQSSAPTPIPAATLQAGQQLMHQILATFTPTSTQPLTC